MNASTSLIPTSGFFFAFRGRGYVIGLIAGGCLLASDWFCGIRYHDTNYYAQHGWPKLAAFMLAAALVWSLNSWGRDESLGVDQQSMARRTFFRRQDSLFFIPAQFWPVLLCLLGGVFYFVRG
jgi:hypothetical protein